MRNLAGNKDADATILEELYLANIPSRKTDTSKSEVPYSYVGKIGDWKFYRAWTYWVAKVEDEIDGLTLDQATKLYELKHPTRPEENVGKTVRAGGDAGCRHPNEFAAQPIYNDELDEKLIAIGYKKEYSRVLKKEYISISAGEMCKICNEGKISVERYVDCYHIDDQIGLNEFAKFLNTL